MLLTETATGTDEKLAVSSLHFFCARQTTSSPRDHKTISILLTATQLCSPDTAVSGFSRCPRWLPIRLQSSTLLFRERERCASHRDWVCYHHAPPLRAPTTQRERRCCRDETCHRWCQASKCSTISFHKKERCATTLRLVTTVPATAIGSATITRPHSSVHATTSDHTPVQSFEWLLICIGLLWWIWVRDNDDDECDSGLLLVYFVCRWKWWCDVEMVALRKGYAMGVGMLRWWRRKCVKGLKWCQTRMKTCGIKPDLCVRACWVWYLFFFYFGFLCRWMWRWGWKWFRFSGRKVGVMKTRLGMKVWWVRRYSWFCCVCTYGGG